jgi:leucyl/phenylalanyl-tRNA--protein transferase
MTRLHLLDSARVEFPPVDQALRDPNGLLAVGGDLSVKRLVAAYGAGVFPWFDDDRGPILWWSPDPRAVLFPDEVQVSRRLERRMRNGGFTVSLDTAFNAVVKACAAPREGTTGTWITPSMQRAYGRLHRSGYAHSIEVWLDGELVGGLYGVSLGVMFFGESMFFREPDASKIALITLVRQIARWGFTLLDCQVMSAHLRSLGAREIPRAAFLQRLEISNAQPTRKGPWQLDHDLEAGDAGRAG